MQDVEWNRMSAGLSGYIYMFTTSYNVPIEFTSWTTGRCGREPGILFKLLLIHIVPLTGKRESGLTKTSSRMGGGVRSL